MVRGKKQNWPLGFVIAACIVLAVIVGFTVLAETRVILYSSEGTYDDYCVAVIWDLIPQGGVTFRIRKGPVSNLVYQKIDEMCGDCLKP